MTELLFDDTPDHEAIHLRVSQDLNQQVKGGHQVEITEGHQLHIQGNSHIDILQGKQQITAKEIHLIAGENFLIFKEGKLIIQGKEVHFN